MANLRVLNWALAVGVLIVVGLGVWMGFESYSRRSDGRGVPYPALCRVNLEDIGLALLQYHDKYGSFPPAYVADESGKPMHSWRTLLLPFVGYGPLYNDYRFDEPWDSPYNRKLCHKIVLAYMCPSEPHAVPLTSYVAVVGPGTAWPGSTPTRLKDFRDGTANTILIVELVNSGIHWAEPRDLDFQDMKDHSGSISLDIPYSEHPRTANALFAGGKHPSTGIPRPRVWNLDGVKPSTLFKLLTINGGEPVRMDQKQYWVNPRIILGDHDSKKPK